MPEGFKVISLGPLPGDWEVAILGDVLEEVDVRVRRAPRAEVIVHELLHLKVPNHGKLFKSLLRAHLARIR